MCNAEISESSKPPAVPCIGSFSENALLSSSWIDSSGLCTLLLDDLPVATGSGLLEFIEGTAILLAVGSEWAVSFVTCTLSALSSMTRSFFTLTKWLLKYSSVSITIISSRAIILVLPFATVFRVPFFWCSGNPSISSQNLLVDTVLTVWSVKKLEKLDGVEFTFLNGTGVDNNSDCPRCSSWLFRMICDGDGGNSTDFFILVVGKLLLLLWKV